MTHAVRWTSQKITQRLTLIEPLVYGRRHPLPPFRYASLSNPLDTPLTGPEVNDSDWPVINPNTYWGEFMGVLSTLEDTLAFPLQARMMGNPVEVMGLDSRQSSLRRGILAMVRQGDRENRASQAELMQRLHLPGQGLNLIRAADIGKGEVFEIVQGGRAG